MGHVFHRLARAGLCVNSTSGYALFDDRDEFFCSTNSRVALKILVAKYSADLEEAAKLEAIRDCNPHHPGHARVGQLLDYFEHQGPHGTHTCLVLELLGPSVHLLQHATAAHSPFLPMEVVKQISRDMLIAIDYMHTSCRLIHTGKSINIFQ
jgi:serine/threonine-protein kinase SRPK3